MAGSYAIVVLLCVVNCIFVGIKIISTCIGLKYENIEKVANKVSTFGTTLKEQIVYFNRIKYGYSEKI